MCQKFSWCSNRCQNGWLLRRKNRPKRILDSFIRWLAQPNLWGSCSALSFHVTCCTKINCKLIWSLYKTRCSLSSKSSCSLTTFKLARLILHLNSRSSTRFPSMFAQIGSSTLRSCSTWSRTHLSLPREAVISNSESATTRSNLWREEISC